MAYISGATLVLLVASAAAIPVRYDQRQDGDWNVDAKLQNFFVVLAPSATNPANGQPGINLLEFASKAVPLRLPLRPGSGLQAAAAAVAAATGASTGGPSEPAQDRQGNPVIEVAPAAPAARAALGYFAAPDAAVGAVPMLVAVPVPEVAPIPGTVFIPGPAVPVQPALTPNHIQPQGEPTALLPMLAVLKPGSNDKIPVESVPAEALPAIQPQQAEKLPIAAPAALTNAISAPETPAIAAPETPAMEAPAQAAAAAPAPAIASAIASAIAAAQEQPAIATVAEALAPQAIAPEKGVLRS